MTCVSLLPFWTITISYPSHKFLMFSFPCLPPSASCSWCAPACPPPPAPGAPLWLQESCSNELFNPAGVFPPADPEEPPAPPAAPPGAGPHPEREPGLLVGGRGEGPTSPHPRRRTASRPTGLLSTRLVFCNRWNHLE